MNSGRNLIWLALAAWAVVGCFAADASHPWNYKPDDAVNGPSAWSKNFVECGHFKNSPIDIPTINKDLFGAKAEVWDLTNWNKEHLWTVLNEYYTVKFSLETGQSMATAGGGLGDKFDVLQFHLHWGEDDTKGSEHYLGGKAFPMEMHFVHKNSEYATIEDAVESGDSDALAAVGFFFEIQADDNPDLAQIVSDVESVRANVSITEITGQAVKVTDFAAAAMSGSYYRYFGGLTTPGCQEIVEWTVFKTPIGISAAQMDKIRTQPSNDKGVNYFRAVQALGNREVTIYDVNYKYADYPTTTTTTTPTTTPSAAPFTTALWSLTLLSLAITKFM